MERCLVLLKPDCFITRQWGKAMDMLESDTDFRINDAKLFHPCIPTAIRLDKHYAEHREKDFFAGLMTFMTSGRILALAGQTESIKKMRLEVAKFREALAQGGPRNLLHCSDSGEAGEREIAIWFPTE